MTLSDIAAGIEVTTSQRDRGTVVVDGTDVALGDRLREHADALPCGPGTVETLIEAYTAGASVEVAAGEARIAPMTAAKALHRCGVDGVCPLAPTRRKVVRDWINGHIARSIAVELTGGDEGTFALTTYVETHDPILPVADAVAAQLTPPTFEVEFGGLGKSLDSPDMLR